MKFDLIIILGIIVVTAGFSLREQETITKCTFAFGWVDEIFSDLINAQNSDPNAIYTNGIQSMYQSYITSDFQYTICNFGHCNVYVNNATLIGGVITQIDLFNARETHPPIPRLVTYTEGHLRSATFHSVVLHNYSNKTNAPFFQMGKHNFTCVEVSHGDFRMSVAVLDNILVIDL